MTTEVNGIKATSAGDGVTTNFAVPFQFISNGDLLVYLLDAADEEPGPGTLLTEGADYTITGIGRDETAEVIPTIVPPIGKFLHRRRHSDRAQTADYIPGDGFPADSHEIQLDRLSLITEELDQTDVDIRAEMDVLESRTIRVPEGETIDPLPAALDRANMAVGFDSAGDLELWESDPQLRADLTALGVTVAAAVLESADTNARALMVPEGETIGDVPDLAARKGKYLRFDPTSGEPIADPGTGSAGGLADGNYEDIDVSAGGTVMGIPLSVISAVARTFNAQTTQALMRSVGLGLGTASLLTTDTDGTLAANSDARAASQKAVKAYVDNAVTGLLDFKGATDCSGNPNYPAASKGDAYVVSVAGKIGGASGTSVDIGDVYLAKADNAGGTQAGVGASWTVLEHNLVGALLAANNLSDVADPVAALANLNGLGITSISLTDPGHISVTDGSEIFTVQWGSGTLGNGGSATITFAPDYDVFSGAIAGGGSSNNSHQGDIRATAVTLTDFSITNSNNLAGTVGYWWWAWGK